MSTPVITTKFRNTTINHAAFAVPLLNRIRKESKEEYMDMQQAFDLMGWGQLPDELKIEIYDDVQFMVQELKGNYCSNNPFVQRRRESVCYWVNCFEDGLCSLETAVKALKVRC